MSPAADRPAVPHGSLPNWTLIELPDEASVSEQVATRLLTERRFRPQQPLGLATGRTMEPVYAALVRQVSLLPEGEQSRLRERWLSFNLDEYVLDDEGGPAVSHPGSFRRAMHKHLVQPLGLDPDQVHLPDGLASDPDAEALRYAHELEAAGGLGLQLLGLGLNGHVGFNEPPCSATVACRCVQLCKTTRRANAAAFHGDAGAVPQQAITLGLKEILAARSIVLVVTGPAKAPILRRLLTEPPSPELPASWLRQHPDVTLLADRAALG